MAVAPARLQAQNFDTSGTASLSGQYLFRYVDFFNDENGNLTESCSLSGSHDVRRRRKLHALEYATVRFGRHQRHGLLRFAGRGNLRSAIERHRPIG